MVAFIDQHRATYGVEPICAVLPIAPSTYFLRKAQQDDATTRSPRARQDDERRPAIQRVWDENDQVYGPRKVWRQLRREGVRVARCTVERLMRAMGLRGVARGRAWKIAPASCRERDRRSPSRPGRSGLRCDTARALRRRDRGLYPSSAILSAFSFRLDGVVQLAGRKGERLAGLECLLCAIETQSSRVPLRT